MVSGLHLIGWYGFVAFYILRRRRLGSSLATAVLDVSVALLVLSTIGAWGLAFHEPLGLDEPVWLIGLTHFFLDTFSEGWLVVGVLGLAYARSGVDNRLGRRALYAYAFAVPFLYALAIPGHLVPPMLCITARVAAIVAGAALLAHAWNLRRLARFATMVWILPLLFVALKGGGQAAVGLLPDAWWPEIRGLRVLYIHVMLLGFVSLGLVAVGVSIGFVRQGWRVLVLQLATVALLVGIVPLTGLWPSAWRELGVLRIATWLSVLPPLAALLLIGSRATIPPPP